MFKKFKNNILTHPLSPPPRSAPSLPHPQGSTLALFIAKFENIKFYEIKELFQIVNMKTRECGASPRTPPNLTLEGL